MKKLLTILFIGITVVAQSQTKIDTIGINKINGALKALAVHEDLKHANWSFCITDPQTGKVLAAHESEKSLVPASSQKVITTIAGLNLVGADYTYKTYIEYDGVIGADSAL